MNSWRVALAEEFRRAYPSAMRTIDENVDELVSHLLFPSEHRKRLRLTNLLERTFVEVRRRTKAASVSTGRRSPTAIARPAPAAGIAVRRVPRWRLRYVGAAAHRRDRDRRDDSHV